MIKIPKKVFTVFPSEPENRMRLMLNALRHEPVQVILASGLQEGNPQTIRRRLRERYDIDVPNIGEYVSEVLEPAHQVKATRFPDGLHYEPSHWSIVFGTKAAEFTMQYCIANDIFLGDVFGRQMVHDQPATFRRYRMLRKLYERGDKPLNVSDLSRDLMSASKTIKSDGHALRGLELVTMELEDVDKWVSLNFRWYKGRVTDISPQSPEYVFRVARALNNRGTKTAKELVTNTGLDSYRVFLALDALQEGSFVRPGEKFHLEHQWQTGMAPKGRQFWDGYLAQLYGFFSKKNELPRFENSEARDNCIRKTLAAYQDAKSRQAL